MGRSGEADVSELKPRVDNVEDPGIPGENVLPGLPGKVSDEVGGVIESLTVAVVSSNVYPSTTLGSQLACRANTMIYRRATNHEPLINRDMFIFCIKTVAGTEEDRQRRDENMNCNLVYHFLHKQIN